MDVTEDWPSWRGKNLLEVGFLLCDAWMSPLFFERRAKQGGIASVCVWLAEITNVGCDIKVKNTRRNINTTDDQTDDDDGPMLSVKNVKG